MTALIEADRLRRTFVVRKKVGRMKRRRHIVTAVDEVSFGIDAGETVGYIGPNGAGKSTTIKMLTGLLVPTGGHALVDGLDPVSRRTELARRIGVVFGQRSQLWWDLPLRESFTLLRWIHRVPGGIHQQRLDECIELLEMQEFLDTPVRQLSLGQRMRGEVTAALLHGPKLLVLDEPTIGLDLVSKERLRAFLAGLNARSGTTLLLTTHDLPDIERLCRRLLVIDHGRVMFDGTLAELARRFGGERTLVVDLEQPAPPLADLPHARVVSTEADGMRQRIAFASDAAPLIAAVAERAPMRDLTVEEPAIEDVVRRLYESSRTGAAGSAG